MIMKVKNYILIVLTVILTHSCGIDTSSESSIESYLVQDNWTINKEVGWNFCHSCGSYKFNEDKTFEFFKLFNNDGVNKYIGTWSATPGDIFAKIHMQFITDGEYTQSKGSVFTFNLGELEILSHGETEYWHTTNR